jgi:hypothetical protein
MENKKEQKQLKYPTGTFSVKQPLLDRALKDIDERLSEIETRVFKTERKTLTTRAQQMLLLQHLGVLELLSGFNISNKKKAKLLSVLLNASEANIEDDLSAIHKKTSYLRSSNNYRVVTKTFKDAGLKQLFEQTDIILDTVTREENK